ncbi:hypothetical protein [Amycolatopsis sp. NPDC051903]|uniref:hypothetical protein n=1 Tax=Amycolatopsis sp. NPDC051903 TaxID=3363936 RepID=UPI00378BDF44
MLAVVGECLLALWWLLFGLGIAKFLVVPLLKWLLVGAFDSLKGASGAGRTVRRLLAVPITGLLSRQRKARRGDFDSKVDLFLVDVVVGFVVSGFLQGFAVTLVTLGSTLVLLAIGSAFF